VEGFTTLVLPALKAALLKDEEEGDKELLLQAAASPTAPTALSTQIQTLLGLLIT
jgi:hypothetical protein